MPQSNQPHADKNFWAWRKLSNASLLIALPLLLWSCGQGEAASTTVNIEKAEWSGERILVSGEWARGISTPPLCRVLEDLDGSVSKRFEPEARVTLDGNAFSKKFVPTEEAQTAPSAKAGNNYYVRCTVSLDSGRSSEATAKVGGAS